MHPAPTTVPPKPLVAQSDATGIDLIKGTKRYVNKEEAEHAGTNKLEILVAKHKAKRANNLHTRAHTQSHSIKIPKI